MRVYLDNCCFNRPYDNKSIIRNKLEAEAKLYIQELIKNKEIYFVWSYILEYENSHNPFVERKESIIKWKNIAEIVIEESEDIIIKAESFVNYSFKIKDSIHIACAIITNCNFFITTDISILKKGKFIKEINIINPLDFIKFYGEDL